MSSDWNTQWFALNWCLVAFLQNLTSVNDKCAPNIWCNYYLFYTYCDIHVSKAHCIILTSGQPVDTRSGQTYIIMHTSIHKLWYRVLQKWQIFRWRHTFLSILHRCFSAWSVGTYCHIFLGKYLFIWLLFLAGPKNISLIGWLFFTFKRIYLPRILRSFTWSQTITKHKALWLLLRN